jgi:DNA-binding transcriptional regulator YbjK
MGFFVKPEEELKLVRSALEDLRYAYKLLVHNQRMESLQHFELYREKMEELDEFREEWEQREQALLEAFDEQKTN